MSPVLNATEIENENDLIGQEEAGEAPDEMAELSNEPKKAESEPKTPDVIRSITLAPPEECGTTVILLLQQGTDGNYRSGFKVSRSYDISPYEPSEDVQPYDEASDEGCDQLADALIAAEEMAAEWIQLNSDDKDENAQSVLDYLDSWVGQVDSEVDESIFDPLVEDVTLADDQPAEPCPTCETPCPECSNTSPTAVDVSISSVPPVGVTDEAQRHFEERKHYLEERIGKLSIEQVRLKAAVKCNRESMNSVTEELEEHICRGPERLPLFDRKPVDTPAVPPDVAEQVDKHDPDNCTCAPCAAARVEKSDVKEGNAEDPKADSTPDAEPWRSVTLEELEIPAAIVNILHEENNMWSLGDLTDHCKTYEIVDLKKIGKAKAEKIEDAIAAYWAKNPEAKPQEAEEEESEDE